MHTQTDRQTEGTDIQGSNNRCLGRGYKEERETRRHGAECSNKRGQVGDIDCFPLAEGEGVSYHD